ncbi:MAG: DUF5060 domain-containing protein [Bacteroidales bacterium]
MKKIIFWKLVTLLVLTTNIMLAANAAEESNAEISGELKMWHKVTLTFDGPNTSETANPNPFTNYRLNVTFTQGDASYLVPGYFAADGEAANSDAVSGNKWRVHFSPPATGVWNYTVSFRSGTNIHAESSPTAGVSAGFMDGETGNFRIGPTDKTGRDMRAKGWLEYVGGHFLRFKGNGEYFLKQGPDSPENFLAYADFDGDFKTDGNKDKGVKTYEPHIADWKPGDPTWAGGKGKGIIGAVNYLESKGLNSFSFLTFNIDGDDQNVFPYIAYRTYDRIDVSRMDQWEIVFEHGTNKGFFLHFKTQECENETLLDKGDTGVLRKLYYRELIARFSHHPALNWNLGEENGVWSDHNVEDGTAQSSAQRRAMAQYFFDNDPYKKHIVMHNGQRPDDMYGNQSKLTGWSHQGNQSDFSDTYPKIKEIIDKSAASGRPWAVASDEQGKGSEGVPHDGASPIAPGNTQENARKNAMWGTFMAGGWGNEWYFGYKYPNSDMNLQDFRCRDKFFNHARYVLEFFKNNNIPVWEMKSAPEKVTNNNWALAKEGQVYVVYLKDGGTADLDVGSKKVNLVIKWYNPRTGGALQNGTKKRIRGSGSQNIGRAPSTPTDDWAVIVGYNKLTQTENSNK